MRKLYVLKDIDYLKSLKISETFINIANQVPIISISETGPLWNVWFRNVGDILLEQKETDLLKEKIVPLEKVWWKSSTGAYYKIIDINNSWTSISCYYCVEDYRSKLSWHNYNYGLNWLKDLKISSILGEENL